MKSLLDTSVCSFIWPRDTSAESEDFSVPIEKRSPCLQPFSLQGDVRYLKEDYLAKKMAGFGDKSNSLAVATADFSELP